MITIAILSYLAGSIVIALIAGAVIHYGNMPEPAAHTRPGKNQ